MADTGVRAKKRTVVMAMDASKHSEHALQWFVDTLHRPGDRVILVYCADPVTTFPPMEGVSPTGMVDLDPTFGGVSQEYEEQVEEMLQTIDDFANSCKLEHRVERLTGSPGPSILQTAYDEEADFIVCGSRGQGIIRRTILGSVSDYIIHHSTIPVIVSKHADEHPKIQVHTD